MASLWGDSYFLVHPGVLQETATGRVTREGWKDKTLETGLKHSKLEERLSELLTNHAPCLLAALISRLLGKQPLLLAYPQ